jgi:hypothetical protein
MRSKLNEAELDAYRRILTERFGEPLQSHQPDEPEGEISPTHQEEQERP